MGRPLRKKRPRLRAHRLPGISSILLRLRTAASTIQGRSDFWGEIWVSLATGQIEYATIYEAGLPAQMKLPGQDTPQLLSVFRIGTLESQSAKN
jgi:hypothetical protein